MNGTPLQQIQIGVLLREAVQIVRQRLYPIALLTIMAQAVYVGSVLTFQGFLPDLTKLIGSFSDPSVAFEWLIQNMGRLIVALFLFSILMLITAWTSLVGTGAIARFAWEYKRGQKIKALTAYQQTAKIGWSLIWAQSIVWTYYLGGIALVAGLVAMMGVDLSNVIELKDGSRGVLMLLGTPFLIFAFYMALRWSFVTYVVVFEEKRGHAALVRSWQLTAGNTWRLFVLILVNIIPPSIVTILLKSLFPNVVANTIQWILMIAILPIITIAYFLFYNMACKEVDGKNP